MRTDSRGVRYDITKKKAKRKAAIDHAVHGSWGFPSIGYYRKGKVHCSCAMCAAKTNGRINKSCGPVSEDHRGTRLAVTNGQYGRKNYCAADKRKVDAMSARVQEV